MSANTGLVLISGYSTTGKSASLRNIRNQDRWVYVNTESNKPLPFPNKFINGNITDPIQINSIFEDCIDNIGSVDGIVVDSLTFLMDMYESQYVLTASNTMKAWSEYNQFFKHIMQGLVPRFDKPVIFLAHTKDTLNERTMEMDTSVPVKGSLRNQGIEAYFTTVVSTKRVDLKELEGQSSPMLNITPEEEEDDFKYVFQTRVTKKTINERIRSPMGMFRASETFIDNDAQLLLDHLKSYYGA